MTIITVRSSDYNDIRKLVDNLRVKDRLELERLQIPVYKSLYRAFRASVYNKTALVDGAVAAMWGVTGTLLSNVGHPYFLTTSEVEKASVRKIILIYKQEVEMMSKLFPVLEGFVDALYPEAIKLLKLSGFEIGEPFAIKNEFQFCRFSKVSS